MGTFSPTPAGVIEEVGYMRSSRRLAGITKWFWLTETLRLCCSSVSRHIFSDASPRLPESPGLSDSVDPGPVQGALAWNSSQSGVRMALESWVLRPHLSCWFEAWVCPVLRRVVICRTAGCPLGVGAPWHLGPAVPGLRSPLPGLCSMPVVGAIFDTAGTRLRCLWV